jgi:hypothetical protein
MSLLPLNPKRWTEGLIFSNCTKLYFRVYIANQNLELNFVKLLYYLAANTTERITENQTFSQSFHMILICASQRVLHVRKL